jgi:hypothetical protein
MTSRGDGLDDVVKLRRGQASRISGVVEADKTARGWAQFAREMDRSRRHERPLAVSTFVVDLSRTAVRRGELLLAVASVVRTLDVVWADGPHIFLAMPETERDAAVRALTRVARIVNPTSANDWRLAIFPDDALTADGLIERLRGADSVTPLLAEALT